MPAVADRLSALDASFLYLEDATTAMHVGTVAVLAPPAGGLDYDRLLRLVGERIALVPRYRQRLREVPGRLAQPVWVDDEDFDLGYHVRRSALPRPGGDAQLHELVARVQGRRLDRERPLWELYVVEGLSGGRVAVVSKTHQAMVDGEHAVDIAEVLLDDSPDVRPASAEATAGWTPAREPTDAELLVGAIGDLVRRPTAVLDVVRSGVDDLRATAGRLVTGLGGLATVARATARPAPSSPLTVPTGEHRRFTTVDTDLDDYRAVRAAHGVDVNDVVLATVTGALRQWLMTRGEPVATGDSVRALVPVSVRDGAGGVAREGTRVASYLVDLPVGEPSAVVRLAQVGYRMRPHSQTGEAVAAQTLAGLAGFAPPTLHSAAARVAAGLARRWFSLVVSNVPGPQRPRYAAGARLLAPYPVVPVARGHALSVGVTSYDGRVLYGLNGDRDAMADIEVFGQCLHDALAELLDTARATGTG